MTEHMRQARRLAATAVIVVLAAIAGWIAMDSATARAATPTEHEPVCATWKLRGTTGTYPDIDFGPKPAGAEVVDEDTVRMVKPTEGEKPGVEFAAFDVDFTAESLTWVSVSYKLSEGASTASTAIRMFGYEDQGADTIHDGPDYGPDIAEADEGSLTFQLPAGAKLGTLGLTYDSSNNAEGVVTFTEMKIGGQPVSFTPCEQPSPSPSVTTPAATTPPATPPATDPAATPSATVPPVAGGPSLPVTGVGLPAIVGAGVVLLGLGALLFLLTRNRRGTRTVGSFEA